MTYTATRIICDREIRHIGDAIYFETATGRRKGTIYRADWQPTLGGYWIYYVQWTEIVSPIDDNENRNHHL